MDERPDQQEEATILIGSPPPRLRQLRPVETEFYEPFGQEWMFDIWGPRKLLPE